ncbi:MAG: methylisocitrate lyase [Fimbriimonadales bacterium]
MIHPRLNNPGGKLRELISQGTVVLPGVYDAITAKLAQQAGAQALYMTGAGVTNSRLAVPDIALLTLSEMSDQANNVTQAVQLPVIADADTGFGETMNTIRTVREYERAGLAGLHMEDQVSPKRCGHLDGKQVIGANEMSEKIAAAVKARGNPDFFIIARTDARSVTGLDDAIERGKRYVDAGADCVFPEGLESESEFESFRKGVSGPLLANMTEFGKTPLISAESFGGLGYNLVIFPMTAFRVMMKAVGEAYRTIMETGTQAELIERMRTRQELYELIEYPSYEDLDRSLAGDASKR